MSDGIRVLRLIEYVFSDAEAAEKHMARWAHSHSSKTMTMRSATLPFETVEWTPPPSLTDRVTEALEAITPAPEFRELADKLARALHLTEEYVRPAVRLAAREGWEWYDALREYQRMTGVNYIDPPTASLPDVSDTPVAHPGTS